MGAVDILSAVVGVVRLLVRAAMAVVITVVAWLVVGEMVASGQLPAAPLGLAGMGFPATVLGIPTAYAVGILLFDGLVLFGEGGGRTHADGTVDDGGGFGGGFGGDGGGGGGDGGGE